MPEAMEGTLLWEPSFEEMNHSRMFQYIHWLQTRQGIEVNDYQSLWKWSVEHLEDFWESIWKYFGVQSDTPYKQVLSSAQMPGAKWFEGASVNYAEHLLHEQNADRPALVCQSEVRPQTEMSWKEIEHQAAGLAQTLKELGVKKGDRVVAYLPNIPETIIACLAVASMGAVWSVCAPEFGIRSVIDRFEQIGPKVLIAVDGYVYGGKLYDRREEVKTIRAMLPSVEHVISVPYAFSEEQQVSELTWSQATDTTQEGLQFTRVPFDHPLWILYSSGTTGLPKPIVQGHGGILLEHYVGQCLHSDLQPTDRFFQYTTTGWVMWNYLLGGWLSGGTLVLYDGHPMYPSPDMLWGFAQAAGVTVFGTSAAYLTQCMELRMCPGETFNLSGLRQLVYTGSPLTNEGFAWVYKAIRSDIWLAPLSGGTDVCGPIISSTSILPVFAGELTCKALGVAVSAWDELGNELVDEPGEMVITKPIPSMPLFLWGDTDGQRYHDSYFNMYPGVWRHGDWIRFTPRGTAVIYGRSDATINRSGVRMGSSEIYQVVEALPEISDSLVVDLSYHDRPSEMVLFVVLSPGAILGHDLASKIRKAIRTAVSPRHAPDKIIEIQDVPRTLNGKKMEIPVRKILLGIPTARAVSLDSMSNPSSIKAFSEAHVSF